MVKIDVSPLKAKSFASTHGREGQENEKRAPRLLRQTEDGLDLGMGEVPWMTPSRYLPSQTCRFSLNRTVPF